MTSRTLREELIDMMETVLDADAHGKNIVSSKFNFSDIEDIATVLAPEVESFVNNLLSQYESEKQQELVKSIESVDRKLHVCRFNDGEQECDCYYEGLGKAIEKVRGK